MQSSGFGVIKNNFTYKTQKLRNSLIGEIRSLIMLHKIITAEISDIRKHVKGAIIMS